jgi:hypothetical protein
MPTVIGRESCGGGIPPLGLEGRSFTRSVNSAWPRRWVTDPASLGSASG